jgi:hypothetical protein
MAEVPLIDINIWGLLDNHLKIRQQLLPVIREKLKTQKI